MRKRRLALLLAVACVAIAWASSRRAWPQLATVALATLEHLEPNPSCGDGMHRWAALVQGLAPEREGCLRRLVAGWRSQDLMTRIAIDPRRADAVRLLAFGALADADVLDPSTQNNFLHRPSTSPALRRRALARLWDASGGADAADDARNTAVHGLADDAALALAARGEPGSLLAAWRAARAIPTARGVYAALGVTRAEVRAGRLPLRGRNAVPPGSVPCLADCDARARAALYALAREKGEEPGPPQRPVAVGDGLLELLGDGDDADHLREELRITAAWIGEQRDRSRALLDAVAHTRARAERSDAHGVLRNGAGAPGATGLVGRILAAEAAIDVVVFGWDRGVVLQTSQGARLVTVCAAPRQVAVVPRSAARLSPTDVGVAAALEAVGTALAAGEIERARALLAYAATGPAPGAAYLAHALATLETVVAAAGGAAPGGPKTTIRFAPIVRPPLRRTVAPLPDPLPVNAGATSAPDATALALAAWWAAAYGHRDLARALAPLDASGTAGIVARAAAHIVGEPVGKADVALLAETHTLACAPPLLPWPLPR